MKFGRIVLQVNAHRLMESDFPLNVKLSSDVIPFHAEKCYHLVIADEASARCICNSVRQFLIHSTIVLVGL